MIWRKSALLLVPGVASLALWCVAAQAPRAQTPIPTEALDPRVRSIVDAISEERLAMLLRRLVAFETRHTLSAPDSAERGIGAARRWIRDELARASPRLQVAFDTHRLAPQGDRVPREVELQNVVAMLPGRSPRRIYVTAHYDSLARRPRAAQGPAVVAGQTQAASFDDPAPGANDDGSGTVLVMELARVFAQSGVDFDATLVFAAFAGEEQGLLGARAHARAAAAAGLPIDAVFNNDIVGNSRRGDGVVDGARVRVFSEGPEDSPSRQLARFIRRWAARYVPGHTVDLVARQDRFGRGGDHIAFNEHGYAAVRVTEAAENYARQHTVEDTIDGVDVGYLARNARVNAAAVAVLALAPPAPVVDRAGAAGPTPSGGEAASESGPAQERGPAAQRPVRAAGRGRPMIGRGRGYDAVLQWQPSPGAAGYRVFWRRAWTLDWEHELPAGRVTEIALPGLSIDDYVFGVAAVGPDGHESLVSAYVNPPRRDPPLQLAPR
ncbi:MAG TPA: M20/M25/M40 family metallo-hydrolase [Vicinamibacterales bacterium]|nr:M20/M25/M40 family metallo-hydrolase [Vicinamibacterales bacterium]